MILYNKFTEASHNYLYATHIITYTGFATRILYVQLEIPILKYVLNPVYFENV